MKTFDNLMPHASFPIGGIGTGTISLEPNGRLDDFQIFNRPSLGLKIPYSFLACSAAWEQIRMRVRWKPLFFRIFINPTAATHLGRWGCHAFRTPKWTFATRLRISAFRMKGSRLGWR